LLFNQKVILTDVTFIRNHQNIRFGFDFFWGEGTKKTK